MMKPPVWTWEVPLYFWFGGIAAGLVVRRARLRPRGRPPLGARRARVALGAVVPCAAAARPRPRPARALPQHAADLQAALADVDGRVVPGRLLDARGRRRRGRPARHGRAAARALGAPTRSSAATSAPTPASCSPRPRCRCGRARTCSSAPIFVCTATATGAAATGSPSWRAGMPPATRRARRSARRDRRDGGELTLSSINERRLGRAGQAPRQGRPGALQGREVARRAGLACASRGPPAPRPPGPPAGSVLFLAGRPLFRFAWVGAGPAYRRATTRPWPAWPAPAADAATPTPTPGRPRPRARDSPARASGAAGHRFWLCKGEARGRGE